MELVPLTQKNPFKSVLMDAGRGFFHYLFFLGVVVGSLHGEAF